MTASNNMIDEDVILSWWNVMYNVEKLQYVNRSSHFQNHCLLNLIGAD